MSTSLRLLPPSAPYNVRVELGAAIMNLAGLTMQPHPQSHKDATVTPLATFNLENDPGLTSETCVLNLRSSLQNERVVRSEAVTAAPTSGHSNA